ncbi:MAG: hypothetical protein HOW73_45075 [Polyangiaceae bacterium]|nr:hypothetical protein [Polyangiaceae bacterium]
MNAPKTTNGKGAATTQSRLVVLMDGKPLPDEEAREIWNDFSLHMDEHQGDFAGFAKKRGWTSVKPEPRAGKAVLVVTTGTSKK